MGTGENQPPREQFICLKGITPQEAYLSLLALKAGSGGFNAEFYFCLQAIFILRLTPFLLPGFLV